MNKLHITLSEINKYLSKSNLGFVLTRFNPHDPDLPDDLDILVRQEDFDKVVEVFKKNGYKSFSHDQALGGRIAGMQKNIVREGKIKIDLHQDFTWRKTRYLDLNLIWDNLDEKVIEEVKIKVPKQKIDAFIVMINIIFEKTYITRNDWAYLKENLPMIFSDAALDKMARSYGWHRTYKQFQGWWEAQRDREPKLPVFLPPYLVIFSYIEKLLHEWRIDLISLLYYFFFRTRYLINKTLPYE